MAIFHIIEPLPRLTKRQMECLHFIATYLLQNSEYPTQKEIAEAMGLCSNTAYTFTEPLLKKGYLIKNHETGRRNLRMTDMSYKILNGHKK